MTSEIWTNIGKREKESWDYFLTTRVRVGAATVATVIVRVHLP
jgi:hypothetical protein